MRCVICNSEIGSGGCPNQYQHLVVNTSPTVPFTCPVCGGNGLVANGFYTQTGGIWSSGAANPETCRSCKGTGVVWRPGLL